MSKVFFSTLARADMLEISDYISKELHNPNAALRLIRRFRDTSAQLASFPEMGAPLLTIEKQSIQYRYLICGSYMLFYHIAAEGILIDRILYGRRDYMTLLFGNCQEEPSEVSANTLKMMDESIENMKKGKVSPPLDLSEFVE